MEPQFIAIDLKSFYASVECVERGLDPLDTCLVVADASRTDKTICLAVSPALKSYGTGGRPRLFEVKAKVREANRSRGRSGSSTSKAILDTHPELAVDFLIAPPRMAHYIDYSTRIYKIYLRYIAPEDFHVYSTDHVILDATPYLATYKMTAHDLAMTMIREVLAETGVTATAGIGTNMYLCKVAMDIVAKKMPPDSDGVRIASLDEISYRRSLWTHTPMTDFWRIGAGTARRLRQLGIYTMGDLARFSLHHQHFLYDTFGVNAELLIDHAWGYEPVTMAHVKAYQPATKSISSGQVLESPYPVCQAKTVALEMADSASLELTDKHLVAPQLVLTVGYDVESLRDPSIIYEGKVTIDRYGRRVPVHAHGTINLPQATSSASTMIQAVETLFDRIVNPALLVRRITLSLNNLTPATPLLPPSMPQGQLDLFTDYDLRLNIETERHRNLCREQRRQEAIVKIKKKFGKNAILKGLNFAQGATQRKRNSQIGGHHE